MILFIFTCLFGFGLFMVLSDVLQLPTLSVTRAMQNAIHKDHKKQSMINVAMQETATNIARHVKMDEYKKSKMIGQLRAAAIDQTPEEFTAMAITKMLAVLLLLIPALMMMPLLSPVIVMLALMIFFKHLQSADELVKKRREEIESDLPRFASTLAQQLQSSRDVLSMMERYKQTADSALKQELELTTADMRSSGYEAALTRMESRINSPQLSDIVRGLLAVLRGDDGAAYFQMLTHDFKMIEIQKLKNKAQQIPSKIRVYSFLMLVCFLLTYLAIILYEIIHSLGSML